MVLHTHCHFEPKAKAIRNLESSETKPVLVGKHCILQKPATPQQQLHSATAIALEGYLRPNALSRELSVGICQSHTPQMGKFYKHPCRSPNKVILCFLRMQGSCTRSLKVQCTILGGKAHCFLDFLVKHIKPCRVYLITVQQMKLSYFRPLVRHLPLIESPPGVLVNGGVFLKGGIGSRSGSIWT